MWKEWEEKGDAKLIDKSTFKYDRMSIDFVADSFSEYEKIINDGHENIIHTGRTKIFEDLGAVPGTPNFFQVVNHPDNQSDECVLQVHHVCCSCDDYCYGATCFYFSMRKMTDHALNLKRIRIETDDETLKNTNITKLDTDTLKAELPRRR